MSDDNARDGAATGGCGGSCGCGGAAAAATGVASTDTAATDTAATDTAATDTAATTPVAADVDQVLGTITLQVQRYRPDVDSAPYLQEYEVPWGPDTSVLDALNWVKDNLDPSLTFRWSCRMAICGSCGFMLNGSPQLGCEHFVRDFAPGPLRIEPLENFAVERDLVVDLEPFMAKLAAVKPYLIPEAGVPLAGPGNLQTPAQMVPYHDYAMCINCLLCYSACPQVGLAADFLGPAAVTAAVRYNKDSRDFGEAERLPVLDSEAGLWSCTFVGACSTACPKGVDPAAAIQQAKAATAKAWAFEFVLPHHGADK